MKLKTMKSKLDDAERRAFLAEKRLKEGHEPQDKAAARRVRELADQIEEKNAEIGKYRRLLADMVDADTPYRRSKALRAARAVLGIKEPEPLPVVVSTPAQLAPHNLVIADQSAPLVSPPMAGRIPHGWMLAGTQEELYIIRPGDGTWMQLAGMEYARIGQNRWAKVFLSSDGFPTLKGVMYRLPWPVPAGTLPKGAVL